MSSSSSEYTSSDEEEQVSTTPGSTAVVRQEWTDRARTLLTMSRGTVARIRYLAKDIRSMLPQCHIEHKFDKKNRLPMLNEMAELSRCKRVIYFEVRSGRDGYMYLSDDVVNGPSVKFLLHNVHTASELNFTGNCLKGSRPILVFDAQFEKKPHLQLLKRIFVDVFHVPLNHPRSKPFFDHVMNFGITPDGRIWIRYYQLFDDKFELQEIGPRFVLEPVCIFSGSFDGPLLYNNTEYINPRAKRRIARLEAAEKSQKRIIAKTKRVAKDAVVKSVKLPDPVGEIFDEVIDEPAAKKIAREIDSKKKSKSKKTKTKATIKATA